jgi:hypothetical protein
MLLVGNRELNILGVYRVGQFGNGADGQYGPGVYRLAIDLVGRYHVSLSAVL